jgi:AraC-like DNA-binding protein
VVEIAKVFIERNLGKPIDVTRIAREVELTRPGFTRVFREAEGVSPWDFVLARKIRRAEELLGKGLPLSEVADELGFCDQSHFTRVFKRRTGETPGEYRKRTKVQDREGDAA